MNIKAKSEIIDISSGTLATIIGSSAYADIDTFRNIVAEWYTKKNQNFGTGQWIKELKAFAKDKKIKLIDKGSIMVLEPSAVKNLISKYRASNSKTSSTDIVKIAGYLKKLHRTIKH